MIRLARPDITREDIDEVSRVLESGFLIQGRTVEAFEDAFSQQTGVAHAVAVSSGTSALVLILRALDLGPGDAVIVPAFSWPATANAVALCGATAVFADIEPHGWNMDPECVSALLTRHTNVKALLPVDGFGRMADLVTLEPLAERAGVHLIEDAACAVGASLEGRSSGSWGTAGCFSFHPRKIITTGEGGMITTGDGALATRLRTLRNHGIDPTAPAPDFVSAGFNMRLTEFQAAMGLNQMARLDQHLAQHREVARWYGETLPVDAVAVPPDAPVGSNVYQSYVVLLPEACAEQRPAIIRQMRDAGVETTIGTYHIPLTSFFQRSGDFGPGDFPVTDDIARRALALPMHSALRREDVDTVAATLTEVVREHLTGVIP